MGRGTRNAGPPRAGGILEAVREEETLRYGASLLAASVINDSGAPLDPARIAPSSDPGLAALAQLGALRLRAHTCLISLFDGRRQHIVAEAQQATRIELGPAANLGPHATASPLQLSGTAVPRELLGCDKVLDLPAVETAEGKLLPLLVVPDIALDTRLSASPHYAAAAGRLPPRFYAGVPIRSSHAIDIGVLCVVDTEPRTSLDPYSQQFLRHLSSLVMTHLQSMICATSCRRSERMVRGLGSMVEGLTSMSNFRHSPNPTSFNDAKGRDGVLTEGALNARQQRIQNGVASTTPVRPIISPIRSGDNDVDEALSAEGVSDTPVDSETERPSNVHTTAAPQKNEDDDSTLARKSVFSRAANIIRESVEVEGVLFLDACPAAFGRLVPQNKDEPARSRSGSSGEESTQSMASDDSTYRPAICRVLGFSTSESSSINGDAARDEHLSIPDTFFDRISGRYPDGQIINFGDEGEMVWAVSDSDGSQGLDKALSPSSGGDEAEKALKNRIRARPRKSDGAYLMRMFPGARSVAVVPLWDSHKSRWYAGGFVWTKLRARVFAPGELSYLKAFGSAAMAEVARMEVLRESKAKEDVLGSLSHEIRSPLHGIILGVELLQDSTLTGFQDDVLHTVETCGRTLLDTMDHLLDFSKVNHFLQQPKRRAAQGRARGLGAGGTGPSPIEVGMMSLFSDLRLDLLTEEVIESVYAGFSFQNTSSQWGNRELAEAPHLGRPGTLRRLESVRRMDSMEDVRKAGPAKPVVHVHLDLDPTVPSWEFHAQSGALRRIVMNVFGNALKYTSSGHIFLSLTQEPFPPKKRSRRRTIILSVSDSGRGMSNDYLQNRLFTPFAQENQLSAGVGLGLSLVKQIVHGLGGRISVESQLDKGTTIRVLIPLRLSSPRRLPSSTPRKEESDFGKWLEKLKGVSVSLLGVQKDFGELRPLVAQAKSVPSPREVLETLCTELLHMQVVPEGEVASRPPSLIIATEHAMHLVPVVSGRSIPAVVICDSIFSSHQHQTQSSSPPSVVREFVSQPVVSRKLARILVCALDNFQRAHPLQSDTQGTTSETPRPEHASPMKEPNESLLAPVEATRGREGDVRSSVLPRRSLAQPAAASATAIESSTGDAGPRPGAVPREAPFLDIPGRPESETLSRELSIPFLLVDDNAINLKMLGSYMRKLKRGFDCAADGLEALVACRARTVNYTCILMDISMPVMDGLESARLIRAHERQQGLPPALIIALTGLASAKTQQEAYASGIDLFLSKPVPLKELGGVLEARGI